MAKKQHGPQERTAPARRPLTLPGLVVDADGLCLVVPIVVLHAHQMRVGLLVEARSPCEDVLVGFVHGFHHLQTKRVPVSMLFVKHDHK